MTYEPSRASVSCARTFTLAIAWALLPTMLAGCGGASAHANDPIGSSTEPAMRAAESSPTDLTPHEMLLALSKRDRTLSIIDAATLKVVSRLPVGEDPHEVIATPDGQYAYVSNYGSGAFNTLAVLDLVHQRALPSVDLGALRGPHGLVAKGGKVWFTAEGAKAVGSYDTATRKTDWVQGTGQDRTHMIYVSPDLRWIATSNVSSGTVTILEKTPMRPGAGGPGGPGGPADGRPPPNRGSGGAHNPAPPPNWEATAINVGRGPEGFDVSPNGKELWVANGRDGTIAVIDVADKVVTAILNVDVQSANRLKFTPDGQHVLVSMLGGPNVAILDTQTRAVVKRVAVGHGSSGILMQPDGSKAYVACTPDNQIAVIDLKTYEVTGHLDVGPEPDGLAWATRK